MEASTSNRFLKLGFGYGVLATLVMSFFMLVSVLMEISPMPAPIPVALVKKFVAGNLPKQALIISGLTAHFLYGGIAGALFATMLGNRVGVSKGLGWGVLLWVILQLLFLPLLGWGAFGAAVTPAIAVATLLLHLIYGGVLGAGLSWHYESVPATAGKMAPPHSAA